MKSFSAAKAYDGHDFCISQTPLTHTLGWRAAPGELEGQGLFAL